MPTRTIRKGKRRAPSADEYTDDDEDEVEEEERPRRKKSSVKSSKRKPRSRDDDDEEEDEDDEDERPRSKSKKSKSSKSRHEDDDDDEDEDDRPKKKGHSPVKSGLAGWREQRSKSGDFVDAVKIEKEAKLMKFLDDEPFATYRQHWIERTGKKSWTCLDDDCPLCDLGDRPRAFALYNVVVWEPDSDEPEVGYLQLSPRPMEQIINFSSDKKTGPMTKLYWAVSKSGKGSKTSFNFRPVKERDLEEDYEVEPLDKAEIKAFKKDSHGPEIVQYQSRKQLKEIARELNDDEDDEDDDD